MMTAVATPDPRPALKRPRRTLRCLLGKHDPGSEWMRIAGSSWHTVGRYCRRCSRVLSVHVERR